MVVNVDPPRIGGRLHLRERRHIRDKRRGAESGKLRKNIASRHASRVRQANFRFDSADVLEGGIGWSVASVYHVATPQSRFARHRDFPFWTIAATLQKSESDKISLLHCGIFARLERTSLLHTSATRKLEHLVDVAIGALAPDEAALQVPANYIESIAYHSDTHAMPRSRHRGQEVPLVVGGIVRLHGPYGSEHMSVINFAASDIDATLIRCAAHTAPCGRHSQAGRTPAVRDRIIRFDNIGVAANPKTVCGEPAADDVDLAADYS